MTNVVNLHDPIAHARAVRARLRNPLNPRFSDEREILSPPGLRRRRIQTTLQLERERREQSKAARLLALEEALRAVEAKREIAAEEAAQKAGDVSLPMTPRYSSIIAEVCRRYNVTLIDLISSRRTADIVLPRQITMYLARHLTTLSFPQIACRMGGRDHTTAMHAVNKIKALVESRPHLAAEIDAIKRSLGVV